MRNGETNEKGKDDGDEFGETHVDSSQLLFLSKCLIGGNRSVYGRGE